MTMLPDMRPQSTGRAAPVTALARSEARKPMTRATSSGSTMRPNGYQPLKCLQDMRVFCLALVPKRCAHRPRQHDVGADAVTAIFLCDGTGHRNHRRLGCAVSRVAQRSESVDRSDGDDVPAATRDHLGQHGMGACEGAIEVRCDINLPTVGVGLRHRGIARTAGVVDQDMHLAKPIESALNCRRIRDVHHRRLDVDMPFGERLGQRLHLVAAVYGRNSCACFAEVRAQTLPDASTGPRDGDSLASEGSTHLRAPHGRADPFQIGSPQMPIIVEREFIDATLAQRRDGCEDIVFGLQGRERTGEGCREASRPCRSGGGCRRGRPSPASAKPRRSTLQ